MAWESVETVNTWCAQQKEKGNTYLLLCCDRFEYEQYPVGATAADFWEKYDGHNGHNMQSVDAVYDLTGEYPMPSTNFPPKKPKQEAETITVASDRLQGDAVTFTLVPDAATGKYRVSQALVKDPVTGKYRVEDA